MPYPVPPKQSIRDFPALVRWVADAHHGGHPFRLAGQLKVSSGLIWHWLSGAVKSPALDTLRRLCHEYHLELAWVLSLIPAHAELLAELKGWRRPTGRGPTRRSGRGAARAEHRRLPQPVETAGSVMEDYVKFAKVWLRWLLMPPRWPAFCLNTGLR